MQRARKLSHLADQPYCAVLAAHAMLWNDNYVHQIKKEHGDKTAQLVAQSHETAIDTLEQACFLESRVPNISLPCSACLAFARIEASPREFNLYRNCPVQEA